MPGFRGAFQDHQRYERIPLELRNHSESHARAPHLSSDPSITPPGSIEVGVPELGVLKPAHGRSDKTCAARNWAVFERKADVLMSHAGSISSISRIFCFCFQDPRDGEGPSPAAQLTSGVVSSAPNAHLRGTRSTGRGGFFLTSQGLAHRNVS